MANAAITVDLNAKIANFETELKKATGSLDRFEKKSQQASAAIKNAFGTLGLTIGAGVMVRQLTTMADEFKNLQARLKLVSRDVDEFNAANADLVRISESAAAPLSATAKLYTRIAASVKDLNVSQRQVADTTEAVALAMRISGASAAESTSAMLQFSQSIASGVLRGEEFNAVSEAAPRLMQALAASLKVPIGSLREMASNGQITRDILINGLLSELPKLQQEAASLPKTIGVAFTDLNNKLLLAIGHMDKLSGATDGVSTAISGIGTTGIEALSVLGANVAFVFKGIGNEIGGIAAQLSRLAVGDFKGFSAIGQMMKSDAALARKELDEFEKKILGIGKTARSAASSASVGATASLPSGKPTKTKTTRSKSDPLDSLLGQTDIVKMQEFDKTVALLNQRFDYGRKNTELYAQAMNKLIETTFSSNFDEFNKQQAELADIEKDVAAHLKATNDAIYEQNQAWMDAGRALEDEMRTPLENANIEFGRLQDLLDRGAISWETYTRAVLKTQEAIEQTPEKLEEMDVFAKKAAENIQQSFADFLFDPFDKGMKGMLQGFGEMVKRMIADAVAADLAKSLFGDLAKGGSGDGVAGGLLKTVGGWFGFADGGIAANGRPVPLARFAGGGVSNTAAIFGEAGPEAAVPLPDGRSIPVTMKGGGGNTYVVNVNGSNNAPDVRRAAGQGMREALGMMNGAKRYA